MTGPLATGLSGLVPLGATLLLLPVAARLARATGFLDLPRPDRHHRRVVPLLGGLACVVAIACGLLLTGGVRGDRALAMSLLAGPALLFCLGLRDDRAALRAIPKGLAEVVILALWVAILPLEGRLAGWPERGAALAVAIVLLNAWNYLDHADGLFAAAAIGSSALLALGVRQDASELLPLPLATLGAALGFLAWNRPPARIFLGDAGSLPIGCLLVSVSLLAFDRLPEARLGAPLAAQAVPLAEFLLVTVVRLLAGRNPLLGGCEHSGHRIVARFGATPALAYPLLASASLGAIAYLSSSLAAAWTAILFLAAAAGLALAVARLPAPESGIGARSRAGGGERGSGSV